jgi:hypothetical protein
MRFFNLSYDLFRFFFAGILLPDLFSFDDKTNIYYPKVFSKPLQDTIPGSTGKKKENAAGRLLHFSFGK